MNTLLGPIVTADELCVATEAILRAQLEPAAVALGLTPVQTWQQDPSEDALTSAAVPAVSISSAGSTDVARRAQGYEIDFQLSVAIFDRGENHAETQYRVRTWAALLTAVIAQNSKLGGIAERSTITQQRIVDPGRGAARTLGGCAVTFTVEPAALAALHLAPPNTTPLGTVQTTNTTVTRQ